MEALDRRSVETIDEEFGYLSSEARRRLPTRRQLRVLEIVAQGILKNGHAPTLREIGELMGIRSTNGVNDHINGLERRGLMTRDEMKSRARFPTPEGWTLIGLQPPRYGALAPRGTRVLEAVGFLVAYRCRTCQAQVWGACRECPQCGNEWTLYPEGN